MTKSKRIRMTILFLVGALASVALGISIATAVGAITTPMQTWGYAYLDSIPVPHGTIIDVYIGDDTIPSGSCNTSILGRYGSMMITGDTAHYGEPLRYTIDGYPTDKIGPDEGIFGLENQEVSLHGYTNIIPITPTPTHTWTFYGNGFEPKHLPDWFTGTVNLSTIDNMPIEIQGVYKFDDITSTWLFWCDGAPGTTLAVLEGGLVADYMVSHYGACEWEIPLQ
jgi:hypothetical protein